MIDKTTVGVTAEPEEVEAVLHNLCGYHLAERDPVFRYTVLTREQVLYDALVAAIKRERGRALAELVASGTTMTNAAKLTNLTSRQQVQRLIAIAKAAEAAAAEVMAASNDFEDRMTAVQATLDEVVSGIVPVAEHGADPEFVAEPVAEAVPATVGAAAGSRRPAADQPESFEVPIVPGEPISFTPVIHPTREVQTPEDTRWWRRGRDSGAA